LGWLDEARPDLVAEYARLYPRSYAPKATQEALSRQVAGLVAKYGGRTAAPTDSRAVKPRPRQTLRSGTQPARRSGTQPALRPAIRQLALDV
jgi:hypothetical protein